MKIENQVCSLELSKRLKELGVKQESYFKYELRSENPFYFEIFHSKATSCAHQYYKAYTVAELGEMLPEDYISCKTEGTKYPCLEYKKYWLCYYDPHGCDSNAMQMEESEANVRAKMLIYLLENKLMELPNET